MKKIKYILLVFFLVLSLGSFFIVNADSGWDSDYSSGSSWGSSSSWGGSSSSDWDFSSGSSYSGSHGTSDAKIDGITTLILLLVLLLIPVFSIIRMLLLSIPMPAGNIKIKEAITTLEDSPFTHDYDEVVKKYFPEYTEKSLLEHLFKMFIEIQVAWINFDYDALKGLCTDQLFQSYKMDLEELRSKHRQNIMSNFSLAAANIMEIIEENNTIIIKLFMHTIFNDYVIDTDTNEVVRGKVNNSVHNQYNLEFVVTNRFLEKCPNCGNNLNGKSVCEYCHTHINDNYSKFVLSKKDKI